MKPVAAIEAIQRTLRDEPAVRALYLSGSYGAGLEDEYSDLDFVAVTTAPAAFAETWRRAVRGVGDPVLWWEQTAKQGLINVVTEDWLRLDVVIATPEQMARWSQQGLRVLFDHDGIFATLAAAPQGAGRNLPALKHQFEGFIRVVGLLSLAIGREEYFTGVTGVFHLRKALIDLLIEETSAPHRGRALHLNRLITDEQKAVLASLPLPQPTREAVIAAFLAHAAAYLPRARRMAATLGIEWPERFEAATWSHLHRSLGIERPYDPARPPTAP